jgi:hypothetical protein
MAERDHAGAADVELAAFDEVQPSDSDRSSASVASRERSIVDFALTLQRLLISSIPVRGSSARMRHAVSTSPGQRRRSGTSACRT